MNRKLLLSIIATSLATALPLAAQAERPALLPEQQAQPLLLAEHIGPKQAAKRALKRNGGGKVLSVKQKGESYAVKLIKNGKVSVIHVPAH